MKIPVIVIGGGGHAKVLVDTLLAQSFKVLGITDSNAEKHGRKILGVPIIGDDEVIKQYAPNSILLVNGLGSIKATNNRTRLYNYYKASGYCFAKVVHQSAIIASDVNLSEGVQIMAGTVIQTGSCIGCNTIINTGVTIDHDCLVGSNVHLAPGGTVSGEVQIGDGSHIGTGAAIIQGIKIGNNCTIGAGSVVINNVPQSAIAAGVPARVIKYMDERTK